MLNYTKPVCIGIFLSVISVPRIYFKRSDMDPNMPERLLRPKYWFGTVRILQRILSIVAFFNPHIYVQNLCTAVPRYVYACVYVQEDYLVL
jgi:hypothetical protein